MEKAQTHEDTHSDKHAWERVCPKCGGQLELLRKLPPRWNWTGMEVANRFWKCASCPYLEPAGQ